MGLKKTVVGLDASLTASAICFYCPMTASRAEQVTSIVFGSTPQKGLARINKRYQKLVNRIVSSIVGAKPTAIFVEGYSYNSVNSAVPIAEFGGILRRDLLSTKIPLHEVAPKTLKKWVLGKGIGSKLQVCTALANRYNVLFETDDEYDAYALARLGAAVLEWEAPANQSQAEAASLIAGKKIKTTAQKARDKAWKHFT